MKLSIAALVFLAVSASCASRSVHDIRAIPGGVSGVGTTTRYWDCCKPTCAWPGNVEYKTPVNSCKADGVTTQDPEVQSGCVGGESYICTNQGQYAVNDTLSYGFVAARFVGTKRNMCCACVMFSFQNELADKKMVVQVTNTGNAPETGTNLFDIAMPGSGVGYYKAGCTTQWNSDVSNWGEQYGGVWNEADCYNLPVPLQKGCVFRFQWMRGISNPPVSFVEVECPAEILAISKCDPINPVN
ncbi:hypothetical protein JTB14_026060 [Gonioctena quinquepunctata]|nr:hypothetical protein JTB14_026060 [Gonioctena quinquepunctata]